MEHRSRITIMSGEVVTFADSFSSRPGVFGECHDALGPFEVSASRDAVIIHRAELTSDAAIDRFVTALQAAQREARRLTREGFGGSYIGSDSASEPRT